MWESKAWVLIHFKTSHLFEFRQVNWCLRIHVFIDWVTIVLMRVHVTWEYQALFFLNPHLSPKFCYSHFDIFPFFHLPTVGNMLSHDFPLIVQSLFFRITQLYLLRMHVCVLCVCECSIKHLFGKKVNILLKYENHSPIISSLMERPFILPVRFLQNSLFACF